MGISPLFTMHIHALITNTIGTEDWLTRFILRGPKRQLDDEPISSKDREVPWKKYSMKVRGNYLLPSFVGGEVLLSNNYYSANGLACERKISS